MKRQPSYPKTIPFLFFFILFWGMFCPKILFAADLDMIVSMGGMLIGGLLIWYIPAGIMYLIGNLILGRKESKMWKVYVCSLGGLLLSAVSIKMFSEEIADLFRYSDGTSWGPLFFILIITLLGGLMGIYWSKEKPEIL